MIAPSFRSYSVLNVHSPLRIRIFLIDDVSNPTYILDQKRNCAYIEFKPAHFFYGNRKQFGLVWLSIVMKDTSEFWVIRLHRVNCIFLREFYKHFLFFQPFSAALFDSLRVEGTPFRSRRPYLVVV